MPAIVEDNKSNRSHPVKKKGWSWPAKILVIFVVVGLFIAAMTILINTPSLSHNPANIIKSSLNRPDSWNLRSIQYKDGILICGGSAAWKALTPVWYAKGEMVYAVNGAANSINSVKYEFVSAENSPELGISISDIVAVCEKL